MTSVKSISDRRKAIEELKEKHTKLFELEGIEKPKFIPKMAYIPKDCSELIIAFFPSELLGGEDIYTEFADANYIPTDPVRTLYKWQFNPEFDIEYQKSEPHPATGLSRYYIPVAELIEVGKQKDKKKLSTKAIGGKKNGQIVMNLIDPVAEKELKQDVLLSEMTMRDELAIRWERPVSLKKWLNDLIIEKNNSNNQPLTSG